MRNYRQLAFVTFVFVLLKAVISFLILISLTASAYAKLSICNTGLGNTHIITFCILHPSHHKIPGQIGAFMVQPYWGQWWAPSVGLIWSIWLWTIQQLHLLRPWRQYGCTLTSADSITVGKKEEKKPKTLVPGSSCTKVWVWLIP